MKHLYLTTVFFCLSIAAFAQCNPSFNYTILPPSGNSLLKVSINNTSIFTGGTPNGEGASYTINYGDGYSENIGGTDNHNYATAGTYNVTLTMNVYDTGTATIVCSNSTSQSVTVNYTPCATSINYSASGAGSSEIFNFAATTPAGPSGMTYSWDFGDGTTGTGATPSHTYTNGLYAVTLTATSTSGCTYTNVIYVSVSLLNCSALAANFSYDNYAYSNVSFTNTSDTAYGANTTGVWNYGDGTSGNSEYHSYSAAGTYTVTLTMMWINSSTNDTCLHTVSHDIVVDNSPPPINKITGFVNFAANIPADTGLSCKVWLIQFDAATNNLYAVDSSVIYLGINYSNQAYYEFDNVATGQYRTKAQVLYNSIPANELIPTYDTAELYWNTAWVINHTSGSLSTAHIRLQTGAPATGPGFIGGDVTQGANRGTAADGAAGMNIFLRDANNNVVRYTVTDANGSYSFSNIPNGTYSVYPEALNYATTPYSSVTLSANNETAASVSFQQHTVSKTITPVTTIVENVNKGQNITIYPNPASGIVNIAWQNGSLNAAHVTISDAVGRKVSESIINVNANSGIQSINLSSLKDGIYLINITTDGYNQTKKLIIQH